MKLLLDTHIVLWMLSDPDRLSDDAQEALLDEANEALISAVTGWEVAIKQSLGKLTLPGPAETWLPLAVGQAGLEWLPISERHALAVRGLPWHHRDPFDRLLIAQSTSEGCTLMTHDQQLAAYGGPVMLV